MWDSAYITHDTTDKFRKLMLKTDLKGYSIIHLAVMYNKFEIIQWIWQRLNVKIFYEKDMRIFVKMRSADERNILQLAATRNKDEQVHQWLWDKVVNIVGKDGLREMVLHEDCDGRNVRK